MSNLLKSRIAFNIVQPSFSVQGPCFHFHVKPACAFTSLAIAPEESRMQFSSVLMKSSMFSCTYQIYQSTPWPLGVPTYTAMAYPHLGSSPLHTNHVCWLGSIGLLILWTYPISQFLYYILWCVMIVHPQVGHGAMLHLFRSQQPVIPSQSLLLRTWCSDKPHWRIQEQTQLKNIKNMMTYEFWVRDH
jgi:hypothetical protein